MKKVLMFTAIAIFFSCKKAGESTSKKYIDSIDNYTDFVDLNDSFFDVSELKGKKVLINFWATWCGPCITEMPNLLVAQKKLAQDNYVFLLVSDEPIEKILNFKEKTNHNFRFLKSNKSITSFGVYALPTTFVFNVKGKKSDRIVGVVKWDSEEIITKLKNIQ